MINFFYLHSSEHFVIIIDMKRLSFVSTIAPALKQSR